MRSRAYLAFAQRILMVLALVILSLAAVSQAQAKGPSAMTGTPAILLVSIPNEPGKNVTNSAELKARLRYLVANGKLNPKAVKVITKGCGCAAAMPQGWAGSGFWSCMKGCLADAGISSYSILMCGAACAGAETGIGAIVCAICVGASITVAEVCALGCATHDGKGFGEVMEARTVRSRHVTSSWGSAKQRLQSARAKS